jgi:hypothetical protein
MAESLSHQANMQTYFYGNFKAAENAYNESIKLYQESGNKEGLAIPYGQFAYV